MKQRIRWVKSIDEQSNSGELLSQKVWAALPTVALSVFFALIFMMATIWALTDMYEELRIDGGYIALALMLFFVVSMAQALIGCSGSPRKILLYAGVLGCIGIGFGGSLLFAEKEQELWDVRMVILFVFLVVLWLARILHKNSLLILPAGVAQLVLLTNAKVPGKGVLFLLLAGILLCSAVSWERADMQTSFLRGNRNGENNQYFVWLVRGLIISVVCGVILLAGSAPAQRIVENNAKDMVSLVSGITQKLSGWELWEKLDLPPSLSSMAATMFRDEALDYEQLSNTMPEYKQTEVLRVEMSQMPEENIYLRGFCGDTYVDGSWQRDLESLERACLEDEREYDAARAQIAFLTVRKLQGQTNIGENTENSNLGQIRVHYTGMVSEQVYYPYFAMVTTKGIGLVGDSGFTKEKKVTEVSFEQWMVNREALPEITSEKNGWDIWYGTYLEEHYLEVPAELTIVGEIAAQIEAGMEPMTGEEVPKITAGIAAGEVLPESADNKNRLAKAQAVAVWLEQNTAYSLNPPMLAEGTDPIEYFLSTSKTGYCMHYASAAVMLLREMGVPARYASGYMVEADTFVWQEKLQEAEGTKQSVGTESSVGTLDYVASVLDDRAHAWVEIYLDTIGWVPVEVTKGYPVIDATQALSEKLQVQETIGAGMTGGGSSDGSTPDDASGTGADSEIIGEIVQSDALDTESEAGEEERFENSEGEEEQDAPDGEADAANGGETSGEDEEASDDEIEEDDSEESQNDAEGDNLRVEPSPEPSEDKRIVMVTPVPTDGEEIVADTRATTRKIMIYILCGLVIIGVLVALVADTHKFFGRESGYYKQLRREMKRGNHKRVIMMINSGVYRKLHFKKLLEEGSGDEAYAKALKDNYKQLSEEEWERYMAIVKKVAFSKAEFTQEDVKFCFDVYRDVIYKDEVW